MSKNSLFVGREEELRLLKGSGSQTQAQLVVIYGRRRVGKTSLVEEAYKDNELLKFEGLEGQNTIAQLSHFAYRLGLQSKKKYPLNSFSSWSDALDALGTVLESKVGRKITVFFDEFQWSAEMKGNLVALLKSFWDNSFSENSGLTLILCGSISSFMVKKVIRSNALYGRVDKEILLKPLALNEIRAFFPKAVDNQTALNCALCFGGVPEYLERLDPDYSIIQNLNALAFQPQGYFIKEYERIFISHFGTNPIYEKVVRELAIGSQTANDLASRCKVSTGGGFTEVLMDLTLAGFIERYYPIDKKHTTKLIRYRLYDEYLYFYFKMILPAISEIMSGQYTLAGDISSQEFSQWRGYAFERLCAKNHGLIAKLLGFSGIDYNFGSWFQRGTKQQRGAQIDLLFKRSDNMLTICETKYTRSLNASSIKDSFNRKTYLLEKKYPHYRIQSILIVANDQMVTANTRKQVDKVIVADELLS